MKHRELKQAIRAGFAWPGGYRLNLLMGDGEAICTDCGRANFRLILGSTRDQARDGWQFEAVFIHWEGEPLACAHCGKKLPSEYGANDE